MKSTKEMVKLLRLDEPNYEFSREDLFKLLNEYLADLLRDRLIILEPKFKKVWPGIVDAAKSCEGFNYSKFKKAISEVENKFWALSNKRAGKAFSEKLWGAFFAIHVINLRSQIFPEISKEIDSKFIKRTGKKVIPVKNT